MDKKTILAVDDEPSILMAIKDTLSDKYNVITAKNGREAVKMVDSQNPDLVIMDVMMPELDGFDAVKLIRKKNPLGPPVIFLSAKTGLADVEHGLQIGAYDYMTKPFSPTKLENKVDEIFARMEMRKNMRQKKNP
jgi:DNA-binding response OmpR family regulator